MKDEKKPIILAVSHCLLNPEVRAKGLSQHAEVKEKILKLAQKYDAKIEQLPCPEFLFLGERESKTYDEYLEIDACPTRFGRLSFKDFCEQLAKDTINNLKKFKNFHIIFIGIARSPSCSLSYVYDRNENLKKGKGLFMQFLREKLQATFTPTPKPLVWGFMEIDYHEIENSIKQIRKVLATISKER